MLSLRAAPLRASPSERGWPKAGGVKNATPKNHTKKRRPSITKTDFYGFDNETQLGIVIKILVGGEIFRKLWSLRIMQVWFAVLWVYSGLLNPPPFGHPLKRGTPTGRWPARRQGLGSCFGLVFGLVFVALRVPLLRGAGGIQKPASRFP